MDLRLLILTLQIASSLCKKHSSSDESIENIIYYKDCNHKKDAPIKMRAEVTTPKQPECVPRMCCTMSCGNTCQDQPVRQMQTQPIQPIQPLSLPAPHQPTPLFQRARKKKAMKNQPIGRRSMSFTRDTIKSLISGDEDIKKILKDLVRVTMQKADLVQMINARRNDRINEVDDDSEDYD